MFPVDPSNTFFSSLPHLLLPSSLYFSNTWGAGIDVACQLTIVGVVGACGCYLVGGPYILREQCTAPHLKKDIEDKRRKEKSIEKKEGEQREGAGDAEISTCSLYFSHILSLCLFLNPALSLSLSPLTLPSYSPLIPFLWASSWFELAQQTKLQTFENQTIHFHSHLLPSQYQLACLFIIFINYLPLAPLLLAPLTPHSSLLTPHSSLLTPHSSPHSLVFVTLILPILLTLPTLSSLLTSPSLLLSFSPLCIPM